MALLRLLPRTGTAPSFLLICAAAIVSVPAGSLANNASLSDTSTTSHVGAAMESVATVRLIVPSGQISSRPPFRVFVDTQLTDRDCDELTLWLSDTHPSDHPAASRFHPPNPLRVIPGQKWIENVDGQPVPIEGTWLFFDLSRYDIPWYKTNVPLMPVLQRHGPVETRSSSWVAASPSRVYLGNLRGASIWTAVVTITLVLFLYRLSQAKVKRAQVGQKRDRQDNEGQLLMQSGELAILCGPDGYLSLWKTQLVAWTLAIGALVFCFALLGSRVPEIPNTLVALMGLSIATGSISALQTTRDAVQPGQKSAEDHSYKVGAGKEEKPRPPHTNRDRPRLSDLISTYNVAFRQSEISIPKAQMVFWTALALTLFVVRTIQDGVLWEVPWQMVALTGISQGGYLADKIQASEARKKSEPAGGKAVQG